MSPKLVHILAAALMAVLVLAFEFGALGPSNAFFGVLAVLVLFTAYKFLKFEGRSISEASRSIFLRPAGRGERVLGYFTYVGVAAVGLLVALQAATSI